MYNNKIFSKINNIKVRFHELLKIQKKRAPETAKIFCITICTLLVPFAMLTGKSIKIRIGSVRKDPPPATVFVKPDTMPQINNIIKSLHSIFYN